MCRLWVYNAEKICGLWTPIRTSDSTDEAKFKKGVFLGHPNTYTDIIDDDTRMMVLVVWMVEIYDNTRMTLCADDVDMEISTTFCSLPLSYSPYSQWRITIHRYIQL